MANNGTALAYWNVNMPEEDHTDTCPDFLRVLDLKDEGIVGSPEALHRTMSWDEVQAIVAANDLSRFKRSPLALRRYLAFLWQLKKRHGTIGAYILKHRLQWDGPPVHARGAPFEFEADDVKVLQNDWPYSIDPKIAHLVVWTKFEMPGEDNDAGALSPETYGVIDAYVQRTFVQHLAPGSVVWFKNWSALKSVSAVEHFHVLLYDPTPGFVENITNGVVPLYLQPPW